jgi:Holliday junction resolvasome RuvABC endonuclease subunit
MDIKWNSECRIAGIDWSITCPAMCIGDGEQFVINTFTKKKGVTGEGNIRLDKVPEFKDNQERFNDLATQFWYECVKHGVKTVFIEDYAFAGNGRITDIAESVGVLKHMLWQQGISIIPVSPSANKLAASGKGNAKKHEMVEAFKKVHPEIDLEKITKANITPSSVPSPIQDIVDAFFLYQYGISKLNEN